MPNADFNRDQQAGRGIKNLILQAQANVRPAAFTDTERLEWLAEHFSGLDFGHGSDPSKQSAYIQPDEEGFQCLRAPKGEVRFQFVASGKFREVLDALMREWE